MHADGTDSWRDDLRWEALHELVARAVGAAAVAEVDLPHIVVCLDEQTGAVSYSGPFPDALSALLFAERESAQESRFNDGPPMRFSTAALYPATPTGDH